MQNIELKNDSFELNGELWHIATDITVGRITELEKVVHHFINGVDIDKQQVILKEIYDDMNSMKFADAGRKLYNLLNATYMKKADVPHPKLQIATMFINKKGEDLTKWDLPLCNEKIGAWKGAPASFFFELADRLLVAILTGTYGISASFSEALMKVAETRNEKLETLVMGETQKRGTSSKMKLNKNGLV